MLAIIIYRKNEFLIVLDALYCKIECHEDFDALLLQQDTEKLEDEKYDFTEESEEEDDNDSDWEELNRTFYCNVCEKIFKSRCSQTRHLENDCQMKLFYSCIVTGCPYKSKFPESVNKHMAKVHRECDIKKVWQDIFS